MNISATEALTRLQEGNRRFVSGSQEQDDLADRAVHPLPEATPVAIVLGCSDSRVPVETVFDQSVGDLFVVRVAGNIAAPSQIGSIEFAVEQFGVSLVVVLGHSMCGAVIAAIDDLRGTPESRSPNFRQIVEAIRPSVEASVDTEDPDDSGSLLERSVRANVNASIDSLLQGSPLLGQRDQRGEILLIGAEYSVNTGIVEFLQRPAGDALGS